MNEIEKDALKKNIENWMDMKSKVKDMKQRLSELRGVQMTIESQIIQFMKQHNVPEIKMNGKSVKLQSKDSRKKISSKQLKDELLKGETIGTDTRKIVQDVIKSLEDNQDVTKKDTLVNK